MGSTSRLVRLPRTALLLSVACALLCSPALLACGSSRLNGPEVVLRMYRAIKLNGKSDWEAEARARLGCGPCEKFESIGLEGEPVTYLFSRESPMVISRADIDSAAILPARHEDGSTYLVLLTLSDTGRAKLEALVSEGRPFMTVNEIGGKLIGLNPLLVSYDQYFAGELSSLDRARTAVRSLGVPWRLEEPVQVPKRPGRPRI